MYILQRCRTYIIHTVILLLYVLLYIQLYLLLYYCYIYTVVLLLYIQLYYCYIYSCIYCYIYSCIYCCILLITVYTFAALTRFMTAKSFHCSYSSRYALFVVIPLLVFTLCNFYTLLQTTAKTPSKQTQTYVRIFADILVILFMYCIHMYLYSIQIIQHHTNFFI